MEKEEEERANVGQRGGKKKQDGGEGVGGKGRVGG